MVGADLPLPDDLTPLAWTAWVRVPCRTCRDLLTALAVRSRGTWRGQVSMADLGSGIGLGEHATRMHVRSGHTARGRLGHSLVAAGLVAFEASAEITGKDRNGRAVYTRHPDRFVLWPTQQRPPSEPLGGTWQEDQAAALLDRIVWFDVSHPQAVWVVRLVGELLGDWPEDELERRLNVTPRTALPLKSPYLFARRRLPERGESFTRPTAEVIGIPAERMTSASLKCPGYRRPTCTGRPIRAGMFCPACEDEARENGDDSTGARMAAVPAWGASGPLLASA
jgi:hypothetical protein